MNSITTVVLLLLAVSSAYANFCPSRSYPLTVPTTIGTIKGTYVNGARAFLGVPFAVPPLNSLRFAKPVALPRSNSIINADQWPNACYQPGTPAGYTQSEDCLYLNVFTPPCKPFSVFQPKLPVMVFIHGGRYWTGYAQQFPGDLLAAENNAIVVGIQYRLNVFGFQAFDSNTNNGLRDQQLALKWVKDNIASFGGDASSITIFGESAGGSSVLYHMLMPSSYPYYNRAILQSTWQWVIPTVATSNANNAVWAAKKGCNNVTGTGAPDHAAILQCLRTAPALSITPTTGDSNYFLPMVDGDLIKTLPLNSIKQGNYNKRAEFVIGHNYDEGNFMAYSRLGWRTPETAVPDTTYYSTLNKTLLVYLDQTKTNEILATYEPVRQQLGNWYAGAEFFGDYYITCGSILAAKYFADQRASFKAYIFNYSSPALLATDEPFTAASHGNELPYVFRQPIYTPYNFTYTDNVMAQRMSTAWTNFARYGDSIFSFWLANYPSAEYFGPNAFGILDTKPYIKDICNNWRSAFELY